MAGGVAIGRNTYHAAIAKQVMLAIDELKLMAKVEIGPIIAIFADQFGVCRSFPFASPENQFRFGHIGISAHVVEMQVGVNHAVDLSRLDLIGSQARSEFLARTIMHLKDLG